MKTIIEKKENKVVLTETWYACEKCNFRSKKAYDVRKHNIEAHVCAQTVTVGKKMMVRLKSLEDAKEWFSWTVKYNSDNVVKYWSGPGWYITSRCNSCVYLGFEEDTCGCRLLPAKEFLQEDSKEIKQRLDDNNEIIFFLQENPLLKERG